MLLIPTEPVVWNPQQRNQTELNSLGRDISATKQEVGGAQHDVSKSRAKVPTEIKYKSSQNKNYGPPNQQEQMGLSLEMDTT